MKRDGKPLQRKYKLMLQFFDALMSPILFYASEVWSLGFNKYCNNNACRAETVRFPMRIEAQCGNF